MYAASYFVSSNLRICLSVSLYIYIYIYFSAKDMLDKL